MHQSLELKASFSSVAKTIIILLVLVAEKAYPAIAFVKQSITKRYHQYAIRPRDTLFTIMHHSPKHLVLIGGGHAHAQVIKALASRPKDLIKVTLIDMQQSASYSGMVPGCVAGAYTAEDTLLHLVPLSNWAGIEFVNDQVIDIDLERMEILVAKSKDPIPFDCVSLDIGSASRGLTTIKGALEYTIPTRPISDLVKRFNAETAKLTQKDQLHVVVIGGGPAGIELSMSVMGRWKPIVDTIRVTVLNAGSELVPSETDRNREALVGVLKERGIEINHNTYVEQVLQNSVRLDNGQEIEFTHCLWATGAESHPLALQ